MQFGLQNNLKNIYYILLKQYNYFKDTCLC